MISPEDLHARLEGHPRLSLAHLPTPLERLDGLSGHLAPLSVFVKRDDQTGLAFGGNKARKLEFIMADVLAQEADTVVTWAGLQSNWCRQVAAAAPRLGLRSVLVLLRKPGTAPAPDGNFLLDRILGAEIHLVEAPPGRNFLEWENVRELVEPILERERSAGRVPYLAPVGGSLLEGSHTRPLGALGYVRGFLELHLQARELGVGMDTVVLATGSAGTQAGLVVGAKLLSPGTRVLGISVAADAPTVARYVREVGNATLRELGEEGDLGPEEIVVLDDYLAEGYGVLNRAVAQAVGLLARLEGIMLDPVYTGKAMAALLDLAEKGYFRQGETVVFLHTGGTPALFPHREEIMGFLES